jgi:hypothetical protein
LYLASFAKTYATLPDAQLRAYLGFLKSDAGRHFNAVAMGAFAAALADASAAFGRELPGKVKQPT